MYIERIYISGYGIFSNRSLPDEQASGFLYPGLTIVTGANESGKTTLLSFIHTILFGFPSSKSDSHYSPLAGGKHGGRITVVNNRGERYLIERFIGKGGGLLSVTLPDGSRGNSNNLLSLLGDASRDLFKNVFAFSLSELQDFNTLSKDEVRARIYSAGLGTGHLSPHDIEAKLKKMQDELFTTDRAISKPIGKLLNDCSQTQQQLRHLADQASEYEQFRAELHDLSEKLVTKRNERNMSRANLGHVEALIKAWDTWTELHSAKNKLATLPEIQRFPQDGLVRLEGVIERMHAAKKNLEQTRRDLEKQQGKLDAIKVDKVLLEKKPQIVLLEQGLAKYKSAKKDLPILQEKLRTELKDLKESLSSLGPGWDEERVVGFDTSIPIRETIRSQDANLSNKARALQDAQSAVEKSFKDLISAQKELERQKTLFQKLPEPPEQEKIQLEERLQTARRLFSGLTTHHSLAKEREHLEERRNDKNSYASTIKQQLLKRFDGFRPSLIITIILLLVPIVGWLVLLYLKRESARQAKSKEAIQKEIQVIERELRSIDDRIDLARKQIENNETSLRAMAKSLQFTDIPPLSDSDALINELQGQLATLTSWQEAKSRVDEAAERVSDTDRVLKESQAVFMKVESDAQQIQKLWAKWLQAHGIDIECSPATALELLSRLESSREKIKNLDTTRNRLSAVENTVKEYEGAANLVLELWEHKKRPQSEFPSVIDRLIENFHNVEKDTERVQHLQESMEENKAKENSSKEAVGSIEKEHNELLADADASDEEDFHKRARTVEERERLQNTIENCTKNLERIAGLGKALEAFIQELEETTPEKLGENKRLAEDKLRRDDEELEQMQQNWGQLKQQVEDLEKEKEASILRLRLNVLKENLKVKAREWSILTIALALLREARYKYERERKPDVVQEGQRFFSTITGGRYPRLISPPGESQIDVEDQVGQRKSYSQLSRGTAEQLYLALRFGFIKEFSRRSESLPIIMDDILVNFDPHRAKEASRAMAELV